MDLLPGVVTDGSIDEIRFVIRHPMSPSEACFEPGTRMLGISLASVEILPHS
jgi:hypothetical protein